jgi:DNA-binding GntR family transcriptional regulator
LLAGPYLSVPLLRDHKYDTPYRNITVTHHGALIDALRERKPAAARRAIASDINSTATVLLEMNVLPHASP